MVSYPTNVPTRFLESCLSGFIWTLWEGVFHPHFTVVATEAQKQRDFLDQGHLGSRARQELLVPSLLVLPSTASSHLTWGSSACPPGNAGPGLPLGVGRVGRGLLFLLSLLMLSEADFAHLQDSPFFLQTAPGPK